MFQLNPIRARLSSGRLFSTASRIYQKQAISPKANKHLEFLSKYYSPQVLESIKIAESLIEPETILEIKKRGFRANSKVAPSDILSDYSNSDPKWTEPVVYPNQAGDKTPYPKIPQLHSPDRSDLNLRFKPAEKGKGGRNQSVLPSKFELASGLAKLTGLNRDYLTRLYVRPIIMKRVSLKTSKGNIPNFFVMTVVGDRNGTVGLGIGKSRDGIRVAAVKAHWNAIKNLTPIPRYEDRTILGDVDYKYHAVKLFIRSAPAGFGLRVNPNIFEVCQAAGIRDLRGKIYKSRNPVLVVKGFIEALTKQRSIEDLAAGRGKKIVDLRKVYYSN